MPTIDLSKTNDSNVGMLQESGLPLIGYIKKRRSEEIQGSQWGICAHWIADEYPKELNISERLEMISSIGAKWAFICPDWDAIEQKKGKYDWDSPIHRLDEVVNGLYSRKINPVIQIYGGNSLYMPVGTDPNNRQLADAKELVNDSDISKAYQRYITALVRRYKNQVKVWEIWNEPNSALFWKSKPTAGEYGEVVKVTSEIIKSIQPNAVIIAGSTALPDSNFLNEFLKGEGAESFDYWSAHPYGELPEASDSKINNLRQLLKKHNKSTEIWQSECGFPSDPNTGGWGFGGPWNETKHAKWLLRRFLCDALNAMPVSIYFVLYDYPARLEGGEFKGETGMNRKGLYHSGTWEKKKAVDAYSNLSSLIDDRFKFLPDSLSAEFKITLDSVASRKTNELIKKCILPNQNSMQNIYLYWLGINIETNYQERKATLEIPEKLSEPVLVNLLDGKVYDLSSVAKSNSSTKIDLFATDTPFAICSRELVKVIQK